MIKINVNPFSKKVETKDDNTVVVDEQVYVKASRRKRRKRISK